MKYEELKQATSVQHSLDWYRARLGKITGSEVGKLMGKGRTRSDMWSATAKSYLCKTAANRYMDAEVIYDDDKFGEYLDYANIETKAMRWGTEQEADARQLFQMMLAGTQYSEYRVSEVGSCTHPEIKNFASSPDGVLTDRETGEIMACLEIKCPSQENYWRYKVQVHDGESLKEANADYYWQCQAHMSCTGTRACFFIAYSKWEDRCIHIALIERDDEAIALMEERVRAAEKVICEGCETLFNE
ncbi:MAG: YqaJ viral recombinase family protein, partial [Bacteroidaceae bacterium]|nr:YqaJ viral recombinase family protein [Bacteroidaceae bacterium]